MADSFQFELVSPERLLLSEQAKAVNVPGSEGYFTVMAHHAPMMSTLNPGVVVADTDSGEKKFFVLGGFADVNAEGLTLLAEHATPLDELSAQDLDQRIKNAQEDVEDGEGEAKAKAEAHLAQLQSARTALGM